MKSCGTNITRECVYEAGIKTTSWSGGGLSSEASPASQQPGDCFTIVKTDGAKFVLEVWESQDDLWNCDAANVADHHRRLRPAADAGVGRQEPR